MEDGMIGAWNINVSKEKNQECIWWIVDNEPSNVQKVSL